MKTTKYLLAALAALVFVGCSSRIDASLPATVKDGTITLKTPARAPGQTHALGLRAEPMDTVRIGFIGLGMRGDDAVRRYSFIEGTKTVALCDLYPDRVSKAQEFLSSKGLPEAAGYDGEEGWKALCERPDVDLVYICTDWKHHTPMAVYAMEHGKHVAIEVPAAMSIKECWALVDACERTRKHCIMLENCVYDFFEATVLEMARAGLFGEIYHVEGAYIHNLDPFWDEYADNWRLLYNAQFRGDNYPTHGIGPVCQLLDIHRKDLMDYVVSMDTDSFNGKKLSKEKLGTEDFANGDHTVSLIRTIGGKQIEIQHNVYAARPYSRMYQATGTEGFANKYPVKGLAIKGKAITRKQEGLDYDRLDGERFAPKEVYDALMDEYKPSYIREIEQKAREVGGHGGMDFIMDSRLIYCLRNGLPLDMDVYDAAEWSCLTELSRISIENGSAPVKVPDFTRGDWNR